MSGGKHTPGPWRVDIDRAIVADSQARGIWRTVVADLGLPTSPNGAQEREANAHLIAAAPDLLALAERIEAWEARLVLEGEWGDGLPRFTQSLYDEWMELQALRNAAIAKAKGESA